MIKHIFFVFVVINVTSTLFCAHKRPFNIYYRWFYTVVGSYSDSEMASGLDSEKTKEWAELFRHKLLQVYSDSQPPMPFDSSYSNLREYAQRALEPWAIEARERQLLRQCNTFQYVLDGALRNVLFLPEVVRIVKDYSYETTPMDHGVEDVHEVKIILSLPSQYIPYHPIHPELMIKVLPTTTFEQFLSEVGEQASIARDRVILYSAKDGLLIESMQHLVYRGLLDRKGHLVLDTRSDANGHLINNMPKRIYSFPAEEKILYW